jgi:hypothetical protein
MEIYKNLEGIDCVLIENTDGTIWSGLKSAYDEQQREAKAPKVVDETAPE